MSYKDDLLDIIRKYDRYMRMASPSETIADGILDEAIELVPHANLTDLMFWSERDRTDEEIAEEAIIREKLWNESGVAAVLNRICYQMQEVIQDPDSEDTYKSKATFLLEEALEELGEFRGNC